MSVTCHVCSAELLPPDMVECYWCEREFHLAMTIDSATPDCGRIVTDRRVFGLLFACNDCELDGDWEVLS